MISIRFTTSKTVIRTGGAALAVAAAMAITVPELSAQRRGSAARAVTGTTAVEVSLRLAERLELSQEQRDQLEAVRVGMLEQRAGYSARLMNLRSEVRAGIRERSSVREELQAVREEGVAGRKALREQFDGILTDDQKEELRQVARRAAWRQGAMRGRPGTDRWRGMRGRPEMDRWPGTRGRPGFDRGRGTRGRGEIDRGRGGDRGRGWRRPGGGGPVEPEPTPVPRAP